MPLNMPPYDLQQMGAALQSFISLQDPRAQVLLTAAPQLRFRQQLYSLGLQDMVAMPENGAVAAARNSAKPGGWRYLSTVHGFSAAASVVESAAGLPLRITGLSSGLAISQAVDAILKIQQLTGIQALTYGLVTLRIPGVRTEAYWLKSVTGLDDRIVPFLSLNRELRIGQSYTVQEFLQAVRQAAQTDLKFYQSDLA